MVVHTSETKQMDFDLMVQEVLQDLDNLGGVEKPNHTVYTVSYNAPVDEANAEVETLEKQGFLVVETYGYDWDMGQVLAYALGEDKMTIVRNHVNHLISCATSPAIREGYDLVIVKNGKVYDYNNYNWEEDRYGRTSTR